MTSPLSDNDVRVALDVARNLANAGIPVFVAPPDGNSATGFRLPDRWQRTQPDAAVVNAWRPGWALAFVMGHGLDLLDVDPRSGGKESLNLFSVPRSYGVALTPSGGYHSFIRSLNVGSRDGIYPGIDIKGGMPDGSSRGFCFASPTVRRSKVTDELAPYRWVNVPDLAQLAAAGRTDGTGAGVAERIRAVRAESGVVTPMGPEWWVRWLTNKGPHAEDTARVAIREKLDEVRSWKPGETGFRTVLLRAAMTIGGYVGARPDLFDEQEMREWLADAAGSVWGSADEDDLKWIEQGVTDGQVRPFHVYTQDDEAAYGPTDYEPDAVTSDQRPTILTGPFDPMECTYDQEFAEAVLAYLRPVLRYASDAGVWLIRGVDRWEQVENLTGWAVARAVDCMPRGIVPVPKKAEDRGPGHWQAFRRAELASSRRSSSIAQKMQALVKAGGHPSSVRLADLDADPLIMWAGGVPYDLKRGAAAELDEGTPHLQTARCRPDWEVSTPAWDRFITAVWPDPQVRAYALRVLSVALAGYPDAVLPVLYGETRTGKSSVAELLVDLLSPADAPGTGYGGALDPDLISNVKSGGTKAHLFDLKGRRLAMLDESLPPGKLAAERLKQLTGGTTITADPKYGKPVTFRPTHTIVITSNDPPSISDPAVRARIRLLPCDGDPVEVKAARAALAAVWPAEAPGVLAQMMDQTAAWLLDRGSIDAPPQVLVTAGDELVNDQDTVGEWLAECCTPDPAGTLTRTLLHRYGSWLRLHEQHRYTGLPSSVAFGRDLRRHGIEPVGNLGEKRNGRGWAVRVLSDGPGGGGLPWGLPQPAATKISEATPQVSGVAKIDTSVPVSETPRAVTVPSPTGHVRGTADDVRTGSAEPCFPWSSILSSSSSADPQIDSREVDNSKRGNTNGVVEEGIERSRGVGSAASADRHAETRPDLGIRVSADGVRRSSADAPRIEGGNGPATTGGGNVLPGQDTATTPGEVSTRPDLAPVFALGLPIVPGEAPDVATVATAAEQLGIRRPEARTLLKAAGKALGLRMAAGSVLALPALVDRAGTVTPVDVGTARAAVIEAVGRSSALTVDVETSGYPVGHVHYRLRSVQLGDAWAVAVFDPIEHAAVIRELVDGAPALHAHSATADLIPLAVAGIIDIDSAWRRMHDTVIPAKLGDPKSTGSDPGLKEISASVLGDRAVSPIAEAGRQAVFKAGGWLEKTKPDTPLERNGWAQIETGCETMIRYAGADVLDTAAIAQALRSQLPHPDVYERERLAQRLTAPVTHRGVRIDREQVRALSEAHTAAQGREAGNLRVWGIEKPGSDPQVVAAFERLGVELPRTKPTKTKPQGGPSVAAAVIERMTDLPGDVGALAARVLEYRHHSTALSLFTAPYAALCDYGDSRARPTIYTIGTDTGRMSCVRPNMQQLSREGGVRAMITADPGYMMIGADFKNVELRVAAALSGDPNLTQMIRDGRDVHWEIARLVYGPDATKSHRYRVKRGVFGRIYGGGVATLADQMGVYPDVAQRMIDVLDSQFPVLAQWSEFMRGQVRAGNTQFPSYSGRIIHLPRAFPHKAPNYAIQGTARELLVDALVKWDRTEWANCTLLPVHDEVDVFVPEADAQRATLTLVDCMATELGGVEIVADPAVPSFAWQDAA